MNLMSARPVWIFWTNDLENALENNIAVGKQLENGSVVGHFLDGNKLECNIGVDGRVFVEASDNVGRHGTDGSGSASWLIDFSKLSIVSTKLTQISKPSLGLPTAISQRMASEHIQEIVTFPSRSLA